MINLYDLKNIQWKRHLHTAWLVIADFKVVGLMGLSVMTVYGIGWDTVIRPNLEALHGRDEALKAQSALLEKKQNLQHDYGDLEQKLAHLDTDLVQVSEGTSAKIVSLTEASTLTDLALGKARDARVPEPPTPHNIREHVVLKPINNLSMDLLHPIADVTSSDPAHPPKEAEKAGDSGNNPGSGQDETNQPVPLEIYNYELRATGTYPALMDLVNQLTTHKRLVKIDKVTVSKSTFEAAELPDAKTDPDYPLKLDMVLTLSIFLYNDPHAPATP